MLAILLSVTDAQLVVSQIVKMILLVAILTAIVLNLRAAIRHESNQWKYGKLVMALLFAASTLPVIKWLRIDGAMLGSSSYVQGRTIEICHVFARGKGIVFEYEVDGQKYSNCNTYHPIKIENIKIPDGYYYVRYARKYPEQGRIDFEKIAE